MIYRKLENQFLKSTLRFKFTLSIYKYISLLLAMAFFGVYFANRNKVVSLIFAIVLLSFILFEILYLSLLYPRFFYKKCLKDNKNEKENKFSYSALRQLLFDSSVNDLIKFLYEEECTQKSKVEVLIEHYESIKTVKANFQFPFMILLSLILSISISLFALPDEKKESALLMVLIITILLAFIYGEIKFIQFTEKLLLNTNNKYDYLLSLLTEIYLKRYSGSCLLKNPPIK